MKEEVKPSNVPKPDGEDACKTVLRQIRRAIAHEWRHDKLNAAEEALWNEHEKRTFYVAGLAGVSSFALLMAGFRRRKVIGFLASATASYCTFTEVYRWRRNIEAVHLTDRFLFLSDSHIARACRVKLRAHCPDNMVLKQFYELHGADYEEKHEIIEPGTYPNEYPMPTEEESVSPVPAEAPKDLSSSNASNPSNKMYLSVAPIENTQSKSKTYSPRQPIYRDVHETKVSLLGNEHRLPKQVLMPQEPTEIDTILDTLETEIPGQRRRNPCVRYEVLYNHCLGKNQENEAECKREQKRLRRCIVFSQMPHARGDFISG